jgi:hypothetical protein
MYDTLTSTNVGGEMSTSSPEDLEWQSAYARELMRTTGKTVRWERRKGGWWFMHVQGHIAPTDVRRKDVEMFTLTLQGRADASEAQ